MQAEQGEKRAGKDRCRSRLFLLVTLLLAAVVIGWISILTVAAVNHGKRELTFADHLIPGNTSIRAKRSTGRVWLVGGDEKTYGNVFTVNSDGLEGPVCDDNWSKTDADVVCRQLGLAGGVATTNSEFGSVPDVFAMDDVKCTGSEARLQYCTYSQTDNCGSGEGAGVRCKGAVWLVGGDKKTYGNVFTVNSNGLEGPVCDDGWNKTNADLVCQQLGLSGGIATKNSEFGSVPDVFAMDDVKCTGSEAGLEDCTYSRTDNCGSGEGAGVRCVGSVWLVGGDKKTHGNVFTVNSNGLDGPVCDDDWSKTDADVVCQQLGLAGGVATTNSEFGSVPTVFAMDNVNCDGSEAGLEDCTYSRTDDCGSGEGAGVRCEGAVWLVGGDKKTYGNVFTVNSDGLEGPVCDDDWSKTNADLVCRQLGLAGGVATTDSEFGSVPAEFAMDDVNCDGSEAKLQDCTYSRTDNCGSGEGAGVRCVSAGNAISTCRCGVVTLDQSTRIVGGQEALPGEFPWQVALVLRGSSKPFCGGTLLSSDTVLTAAHCLEGKSASTFNLVVGEHDWTRNDGEETIQPASFTMHPSYNLTAKWDNDFAIVKLNRPVTFSNRVLPACLPNQGNNYDSAAAFVTGWGTLSNNGPQPETLQEAAVTTQSNRECTSSSSVHSSSRITANMICAAWSGRDSCEGDSGGPLVTQENDRYYTLVGVTSWGRGCANLNSPGVYARVTAQLDWINANTGGNTCPKP